MNWLLIAWLLALTFLSCYGIERVGNRGSLWLAWVWLAAIPFSHFVMALFRAGNFRHAQDMLLIEIWSDAFAWLFLGLSILCAGGALRGKE
jgi:hypothetical protein